MRARSGCAASRLYRGRRFAPPVCSRARSAGDDLGGATPAKGTGRPAYRSEWLSALRTARHVGFPGFSKGSLLTDDAAAPRKCEGADSQQCGPPGLQRRGGELPQPYRLGRGIPPPDHRPVKNSPSEPRRGIFSIEVDPQHLGIRAWGAVSRVFSGLLAAKPAAPQPGTLDHRVALAHLGQNLTPWG